MGQYFENEKLPSNVKTFQVLINDKSFSFYTDNGVFSKRGLDFGTRLMLNVLLEENIYGDILDLGCGYGIVGIILKRFFDINVMMTDVNKRALHLANRNLKLNNVKDVLVAYSNCYEDIDKNFDFIITNPPIRAGKDIIYEFLFSAKKHLNKNGCLYFVINKNQGAKSVITDLKKIAKVKVLEKNKGFFVIKCVFD